MFNKIIGTAGTRIASALISFLIISINARILGSDGVGTIALIILGITIILLFASVTGGAAIVYLVPRYDVPSLYVPSFIGTVVTAVILAPVFGMFNWIPPEFTLDLLFLSLIRSLNANHSGILLGKEQIRSNNALMLTEIITLLAAVYVFYFLLGQRTTQSYVYALYASYGISLIVSGLMIRKYLVFKKSTFQPVVATFKVILRYSSYNEMANFLQLMNYRLGYYMIEYFSGLRSLGVFSIGTRLSESIWITSKSISTVQYARISNSKDINYSNELTLLLFRFILFVTILLTALLLVLPSSLYTLIFGNDFSEIKIVLAWMAPGIVALACSMALSSYFSGTGKQRINMAGSFTGLILTLAGGLLLIPIYGITGAAITASLSYTSTTLYYLIHYLRISGNKWHAVLPRPGDVKLLKEQVFRLRGK